jgi:hypothetical protein
MGPLFIVTERFDPGRGDDWNRYIAWSKLHQLSEVVSLDSILCRYVVGEVLEEDWPHIVNEDFMLDYFTDLDYLLRRCGGVADRNLLCVFRNPETQPSPPGGPPEFRFEGYDLVDVQGGVSALTNCGGFPLAFSNDELSSHGLLPSLERAREVQRALRQHYPREPHADCHVWCVFRAAEAFAKADGAQANRR